jgi:hypothetical protein
MITAEQLKSLVKETVDSMNKGVHKDNPDSADMIMHTVKSLLENDSSLNINVSEGKGASLVISDVDWNELFELRLTFL